MAEVIRSSQALFCVPSGSERSCRFSWAIGEKRTSRAACAVVLLPERMSDEGSKSFPETVQVAERLVVAEEGENDVGLGPAQPFVGRAEIGRAEADSQLVG